MDRRWRLEQRRERLRWVSLIVEMDGGHVQYEPNAVRPKADALVKPLMILKDAIECEEAMREVVPGDGVGV